MFWTDPIARKVEAKHKLESQISILKKQQKVESEVILKDREIQKANLNAKIDAKILALQAQISDLKKEKIAQADLIDEECKITIDKTIKEFDQKIIIKKNKLNRLSNLIDADKKTMDEITSDVSQQTNAPRGCFECPNRKGLLLEDTTTKTKGDK